MSTVNFGAEPWGVVELTRFEASFLTRLLEEELDRKLEAMDGQYIPGEDPGPIFWGAATALMDKFDPAKAEQFRAAAYDVVGG